MLVPPVKRYCHRILKGLARRDPQDRIKRSLLLSAGLLSYIDGHRDIAHRYLVYTGFKSPPRTSALAAFDAPGYYEMIEDENYRTYLRSNLRVVEHAAPSRTASVCDIGCGRGHFLAELDATGFNNCVGYEISEAAIRSAVHPRIRRIDALGDIQQASDIVTLISILEHIQVDALPGFLNMLRPLVRDCVVACIPVYPNNMLDFFDHDSTHVTLERRDWWDSLFAEHGFRAQELPREPLPFVEPFIYRRVK